ncbi:MAG: putative diguanylate phosphodiesterase domain with sensor [Frankiales bacterium]|nr:putative diguanylate phosphodiesterase domain with sensor [Frankiales bacterium]
MSSSASESALPGDLEALAMLTAGTSYADAVRQLLAVVRTQLGMQVAWVSEFVGGDQLLRFVDAEPGAKAPPEGSRHPLGGSFCARVLDGRFPAAIPDTRAVPEAALLDVTSDLGIGAYVGVPLLGPHGVAVGMLCAVHDTATPTLSERDVAALRLLVQLLHDLQSRAVTAAQAVEDRDRMQRTMHAVIAGTGRHAVLQPIVDLASGRTVAAEGLTRFTATSPAAEGGRTTAQWFDDAARLELREDLELQAACSVLDLLDDAVPRRAAVSVNLSPGTLTGDRLADLLAGRPLERVVLEVTEHAPVQDYDALHAALQPYRQQGLRLAVDDAGAGYAALQHVLAVRPDFIKIDMALVRGADSDLPRRTLLTALADFAEATSCRLVAEGVQTDGELRAVAACGVHLAQGYLLGMPSRAPSWSGFVLP